jgi:hypothetical protein
MSVVNQLNGQALGTIELPIFEVKPRRSNFEPFENLFLSDLIRREGWPGDCVAKFAHSMKLRLRWLTIVSQPNASNEM